MRQVILFRHAKSSWALPGMDDFDRPLNDRGNKAAPAMGSWLNAQGFKPDVVLCSSANRTRETSKHLSTHLTLDGKITFVDNLYLATAEKIKSELSALDKLVKTAMVVGHNPGLHDLALRLLTEDERKHSGNLRVSFPTAACAVISLPIQNWQEMNWDKGDLISYMVPKALNPAALA